MLPALYDIDSLAFRTAELKEPGTCNINRRMNTESETQSLRRQLDEMALVPDHDLVERYAMHQPSRPPGLYWQLRWLAGRILRWIRDAGILAAEPWPVNLKHGKSGKNAQPLVIWATGVGQLELRKACDNIVRFLETSPDYAPVLVTDVADFAYFSRLGWLVEYLPHIDGKGESFKSRKEKLLARLYRDAAIMPLRAAPPGRIPVAECSTLDRVTIANQRIPVC